jgi:hypothetical protein
MAVTYEPITTTTLGTATSSITFSSISSAYTDLRVVYTGTTSNNGNTVWMRFNSDSETTYSYTALYGTGTAPARSVTTADRTFAILGDAYATGTSTTIPQFATADIFSYSGSANKTVLTTASADKNGSGGVQRNVNLWRSTSAINAIEFQCSGFNFSIGTTITLYGIKAA